MSTFQVIALSVFGAFIVIGLIVLAMTKSSQSGSGIPVVVWGTVRQADFSNLIGEMTKANNKLKLSYVEKRPESFDSDFIEALASGKGPDLILLPQDLIIRHQDKLIPLPYTTLSVRDFKDTFIQEAELYLGQNGVIALPFLIDPLVMYWNRDLFNNAGIAEPPAHWDEFFNLAEQLTQKDKSFNILKSAVALGEVRNITYAKEILSALLMQSGNPITVATAGGGGSVLDSTGGTAATAINFYTEFANPVKPDYSWNRSLPNSTIYFSGGDLGVYFGLASDMRFIRAKNPNLNFDVAYFPEPRDVPVALTFGRMQGVAVVKGTKNSDAWNVALLLSGAPTQKAWSSISGLPPVRRDLLSVIPSDPYQAIFYNSAIRARAWLDPNPSQTSTIFQSMVESITGGQMETTNAVGVASQSIRALFGAGQ